jgi:type I restriction enzyme S subunit
MKTRALWQAASVGDILRVRSGYAVKSSDYSQEGVPLIRQSDIKGDIIDVSEAKRVPARVMEECPGYLVRNGDVLIGMSGSLGKIGRYTGSEPAIQNQRTGLLLLKPGFSPGFAKLVLKFVEQQIVAEGKGIAVQNVSAKEIEACTFPLPPEEDREHIVAETEKQFTRLEAGVVALRRVQANLKRYRAAVIKAACEGRLVSGDKDKWRQLRLPQFCSQAPHSIRRGPFGSAIKKELFVPEGYKIYEQQNAIYNDCSLGRYFISEEMFRQLASFAVKPNDLIISCSGTVGRIAIIPEWARSGIINQALLKLTLDQDIVLNTFFVVMFQHRVREVLIAGARGAAMQNIAGVAELKKFEWSIPPLVEQTRIVAEVERRLSVVEELESVVSANLQRATRLRQSILHKAFTGELI